MFSCHGEGLPNIKLNLNGRQPFYLRFPLTAVGRVQGNRRYKGCLSFKFSFKLDNATPWQLSTKYQYLLSFTFYGSIYSVIFHCALFNTETRSRDRLLTVSVCYRVRCNAVVVNMTTVLC